MMSNQEGSLLELICCQERRAQEVDLQGEESELWFGESRGLLVLWTEMGMKEMMEMTPMTLLVTQ